MRVVLVGSVSDCARLRARLAGTSIDVVDEARTLAAARAAGIDADAFMLASPPRQTGRGEFHDRLDVTDRVKKSR
jgi:hypothetical protein